MSKIKIMSIKNRLNKTGENNDIYQDLDTKVLERQTRIRKQPSRLFASKFLRFRKD